MAEGHELKEEGYGVLSSPLSAGDLPPFAQMCKQILLILQRRQPPHSYIEPRVPLTFRSDFSAFQEFQPWQAVWLISIDFYRFFLLAFQNIQFICEVNGRRKKPMKSSDRFRCWNSNEFEIRWNGRP
ncbi:hypothetical protein AVEN_136624-1 [Araneus ventricosus]|uniref:Uncharacterized protein n=1 Tax=Araneus ventricosus TaxID=182803 RepID=A0A4Y2CBF9_ARAVE|nr:hypothetical protein AVEN_136624-1 [Araneus ventricosus]